MATNVCACSRPRDVNELGKLIVDISTGHAADPASPSSRKTLNRAKGAQILRLLLQGNSLPAAGRSARVSRKKIGKVFVDAATAFAELQDQAFRDLPCKRLRVDEIWSFPSAKAENIRANKIRPAADVWTWVAIDAATKLVPSWWIGDRSSTTAIAFAADLSSRLASRARITTDGQMVYLDAIEAGFDGDGNDAILAKVYGPVAKRERHNGPTERIDNNEAWIEKEGDRTEVSASSAERKKMSVISIGRLAPLANAPSRRIENHVLSLALHFMYYNFCRIQETLRVTPAMAAGVTGRIWDIDDLVQVLENWESMRRF
jgi:IS1 family transposase